MAKTKYKNSSKTVVKKTASPQYAALSKNVGKAVAKRKYVRRNIVNSVTNTTGNGGISTQEKTEMQELFTALSKFLNEATIALARENAKGDQGYQVSAVAPQAVKTAVVETVEILKSAAPIAPATQTKTEPVKTVSVAPKRGRRSNAEIAAAKAAESKTATAVATVDAEDPLAGLAGDLGGGIALAITYTPEQSLAKIKLVAGQFVGKFGRDKAKEILIKDFGGAGLATMTHEQRVLLIEKFESLLA